MIVILSPAKTLDYTTAIPVDFDNTPIPFATESKRLISKLQAMQVADIVKLMKVSANIATLNHERYQAWKHPFDANKTRAAIYAFMGEAYRGLDAYSMSAKDLEFAQKHLIMLSGLYGALRPKDAILPYRLEMGTQLQIGKAKNLYNFWGDKITNMICNYMARTDSNVLVNLASAEYFKAIKPKILKAPIITPVFLQLKGDNYKQIAVYAKKARGMMSRFIIDNQIKNIEDLKAFQTDGYAFHQSLSTDDKWVFTR